MKNKFFHNRSFSFRMVTVVVSIVFLGIVIPYFINESYKVEHGYLTNWDATDALSFYGSFLAFVGTISLGYVAINQNRFIIETQTKSQCYSSYRPHEFYIFENGNNKDNYDVIHPNKASEKLVLRTFAFIFIEQGKVPAFYYEIMKIQVSNMNQPDYKIIINNIDKERKIFRNQRTADETHVRALATISYDESQMWDLLISEHLIIDIDIKFINSFNVETIGKYRYVLRKLKDNTHRFDTKSSLCDSETYSLLYE